jgi:hypothetical protein
VPSAPSSRHLELTYVYELDAEETPQVELQVVPEDEPVISLSGEAEKLDDEALPFETRAEKK